MIANARCLYFEHLFFSTGNAMRYSRVPSNIIEGDTWAPAYGRSRGRLV